MSAVNPAGVVKRALARARLEAAYRIVLGRPADTGGVGHFLPQLTAGSASLHDVAVTMIGSPEFRRAHPGVLADDPSTTVVDAGGFRIHVHGADHAVGHAMTLDGDYEPEVGAALRRLLRPGDTFVDVGANYGWHSLLAASVVGPDGRVLAIEPNPDNSTLLARSAADSGFANITVVTAAVADAPGWAALVTDGSNGWIAPLGDPVGPVTCSYAVPVRTLDEIVSSAGFERVDVVKVDVEGNEVGVLRGGTRTFAGTAEHRPALVTEFFPGLLAEHGGTTADAFLAELRALDFLIEVAGLPGPRDDAAIMAATEGRDHIDLVCTPIAATH